jgi:hypothetical protein
MWVPRTTDELLAALPSFEETASLEAKREFPVPGKNDDLAVDVVAMSVDGGTIIFGIEEERSTGTFSPHPIHLVGLVERLTSVVSSKVAGSVMFDATTLRSDDDGEEGFLVVSVPPSPDAPHMVESKGEMRFYGRGPGGNIPLTQGAVDRLYERRYRGHEDRRQKFSDWSSEMPTTNPGTFKFMIRPVMGDDELLARAWPGDQAGQIFPAIQDAHAQVGAVVVLVLGLNRLFQERVVRTISGWRVADRGGGGFVLDISIMENGTIGCTLQGAVTSRSIRDTAYRVFQDRACSQIGAQLIWLAGRVFEKAGYLGQVDLAYEVDGHEGATGTDWLDPSAIPPPAGYPSIEGPVHGERRVPASTLMGDAWSGTSRDLFQRMIEVAGPPRRPDFFGD